MKISIITPSYNQGKFIERTLKSVAIQTGSEIEHVVIDGGSTDNTVEILKNFNPSLRWVSEKDKGQTDAVNKGIRQTNGDIIGWLNSDDIYYPGTITRVIDFFQQNPDVDVVYGMADHIDVEDNPFEEYPTEPWNFDRLKETCFICQPALFFRRRIIAAHGLPNIALQYCMDYEYWLRLGKRGVRFEYLPEKLAGSRLYAENKTLGARVKVHLEINKMLKKMFGRVPEKWLFNYAHVVMEDRLRGPERSAWIVLEVGMRSLMAALRWNRKVSANMANIVHQWVKSAFSRK